MVDYSYQDLRGRNFVNSPDNFVGAKFQHADLRRANFRGQNLTEADFSYADIRGVCFDGTLLRGASLAHVRAGVLPVDGLIYILMMCGGVLLLFFLFMLMVSLLEQFSYQFS